MPKHVISSICVGIQNEIQAQCILTSIHHSRIKLLQYSDSNKTILHSLKFKGLVSFRSIKPPNPKPLAIDGAKVQISNHRLARTAEINTFSPSCCSSECEV